MAALGGVLAELGGLPADVKKILTNTFTYLVPNLQWGPVAHQKKADNFRAYFINSTTAASTSEFSVLHGLGRAPYLAIPVLGIDSSATKLPVLATTRPADAQRVYLKADAGSTNALFTLLLE